MFSKGSKLRVRCCENIPWSETALQNKLLVRHFPQFSDLNGKEVILLGQHENKIESAKIVLYTVSLVANPIIKFTANSIFFEKSIAANCKCDVFVTGCICGFFQKEKHDAERKAAQGD